METAFHRSREGKINLTKTPAEGDCLVTLGGNVMLLNIVKVQTVPYKIKQFAFTATYNIIYV